MPHSSPTANLQSSQEQQHLAQLKADDDAPGVRFVSGSALHRDPRALLLNAFCAGKLSTDTYARFSTGRSEPAHAALRVAAMQAAYAGCTAPARHTAHAAYLAGLPGDWRDAPPLSDIVLYLQRWWRSLIKANAATASMRCDVNIQRGTSDSVTVTCGRGSEGGGEGAPDGIGEELKGEFLSKPADDGCECPSGPHLRSLHPPAGEPPLGLPPLATGPHVTLLASESRSRCAADDAATSSSSACAALYITHEPTLTLRTLWVSLGVLWYVFNSDIFPLLGAAERRSSIQALHVVCLRALGEACCEECAGLGPIVRCNLCSCRAASADADVSSSFPDFDSLPYGFRAELSSHDTFVNALCDGEAWRQCITLLHRAIALRGADADFVAAFNARLQGYWSAAAGLSPGRGFFKL